MQIQSATRHYLATLAVLASCGAGVFAGASGAEADSPRPLPPEIAKA